MAILILAYNIPDLVFVYEADCPSYYFLSISN